MIRFAALLLVALSLDASPARAQRVMGLGDDAWTLPSGVLRVTFAPRLFSAHEAFGESGRTSLGSWWARPLDVTMLPTLGALEDAIGDVSGVGAFRVNLGASRLSANNTSSVIPFDFALGVNRRITAHARIPFHTGELYAQMYVDGTSATVGANPARLGGAALASNTLLLRDLNNAATELETVADACALDPMSDARCTQIADNLTAVRALIANTREITAAIGATYGGQTGVTAARVVPLLGTPAHTGVVAQVEVLRAGFDQYGTESVVQGAAPTGAGAPVTVTDLLAILSDSAYGYSPRAFTRRYRQGIGDAEFGVSLLLVDGLSSNSPWTRDSVRHAGMRLTVGAAYRVASGTAADPDDPLRIPTGDGQNDIEVRAAADLVFGAHFWASASAHYTKQMSFDAIARIPDATGSPFVPVTRRRLARTELGDRYSLEVSPRWVLNNALSIGARWRFVRAGGATVTELTPDEGAEAMSFKGDAYSAQEVAIGLTWSSLIAWRRGLTRWPLDLTWEHSVVVAGSGGAHPGNAPRFSADRVGLRVYAPLWGAGR